MLERMWRKGNPCTLLVGMQIGVATVENSMKGRWERGSGWGTHVCPWLIHVDVWQKPPQYCKVISLQLNKLKNKENKKKLKSNNLAIWCKEPTHWKRPWCWERLRARGEGATKDEIVGWHHWLNRHKSEQTRGDTEGQGSQLCHSPSCHKE